ncbi:uncharacterized protein N7496_000289 [Penicillium cataractarum]|uniref:Uncharacterized protein n=1 Tax=Penicillium cataractarum TaxID=2100454 RepID=A0A9W9VTS8_9EURO|nr:uncharacterized protein N7496_000289 [Penicillium cataractarum]KAJ5389221.1 hypothetical protein N7496_000289 [Penicillium cataractarum]
MDSNLHPHTGSPDPELQAHLPSIPTHSRTPVCLRCCCGREDCALLEHNQVALEGLEKDLETAARLGQALLHRHESYIAEAEEDRQRLEESVDALEREKYRVQAENARIVEENRALLEQLEGLNKAVFESDEHVQSLTRTLESTQAELRRVTVAAARAADLEAQLVLMETEQSRLEEQVSVVQEDERSAVQRWKNAESTLRDLHDQVERIEAEAREEREQHQEIIQRLERKRAVERELDNAAGRLKGAAAASELGRNPGTHVVSRFVKDILQDNANLQVGIMELREMLESSNQEVQNLREQIHTHQPLVGIGGDEHAEPLPSTTLSEELESKERRVSQEFHIHHHYHTPTSSKKDKGPLNRRVKKRRPALGSPAPLHSAMGAHSPRRSIHRSQSSGSSMNTILSQTSVSIPPTSARRWSLQSPAADSLASSPRSAFRTSSIFDRVDRGYDFSQPTSPDSTVFSSPIIGARNSKGFDMPFRPLAALDDLDTPDVDSSDYFKEDHYERPVPLNMYSEGLATHPSIPEESEPSPTKPYCDSILRSPAPPSAEELFAMQFPPLRKSTSHDSLLSVAGMDIHTPTTRHTRMGDWHPGMRIPQRIVSPSLELVSTPPVLSAPMITADRAIAPGQSSRSLLASVAAGNNLPSESASVVSADSNSSISTATHLTRKSSTLGRRMGGWVLGRWGMAPISDDAVESDTEAPVSKPKVQPKAVPAEPIPPQIRFRFTGVNQKGPILGLRPPPQAPINIRPQNIDEELLRESLAEGGE